MARPGRPVEPIDEGLPEPVFSWTTTVRRVVFDPLKSGDRPLTLKDIAQRLLETAPPEATDDKPGAAGAKRLGALRSGRSEASVQRMIQGRLVPTRDVVFDLLRVLEEERGVPQRHDVEELWAAYKLALRERLPDVYAVYAVVDGYASARLLVGFQQQQIIWLEKDLMRDKCRAVRADERVKRVLRAQAVLRRALRAAGQEVDRLRVREQRMRQALDGVSAEVARLRQDVATARAQVEHWQEQAEWHLREKEEARKESATEREAWQEREALLLERLAQACETLQIAAEQAAALKAALRVRETHWRDQAQAGHAAARSALGDADAARGQAAVALAEAEAAREEATRVLAAQQERADALGAAVCTEQEQAQQTISRLEEELRQAQAQLRAARQNAVRQDAQLTSFIAERALNADLDDIVSRALVQHEELGAGEPAWIDARPEAIHIPSSKGHPPPGPNGDSDAAMAALDAPPGHDAGRPGSPVKPPEGTGLDARVVQDTDQSTVPPYRSVRLPDARFGTGHTCPPGPAVRGEAPQSVGPRAAKDGTADPDTCEPPSFLAVSGTAGPGSTAGTPQSRATGSQAGRGPGEAKLIVRGFAACVAVTALFALFLVLLPAPPGPATYVSGSQPAIYQSGTGAFGESTTTYTWTVGGNRSVRAHFKLTDQASTMPGHLSVEPAKGCRPNVQWALTIDGKTIADGTLTGTNTHKIKGTAPNNAKTLDITATYAQGTCTATLSWSVGT